MYSVSSVAPSLISIILPVYNAAETVGAAIESCLNQTQRETEVIVVDDTSTDGTTEILKNYGNRIHLHRLKRQGGVAAAFQLGFEHAQGHWIARMDADDLNHPQRLSKQLALLQFQPALDAVSCLIDIRKRSDGKLIPADGGYQRFCQWLNSLTTPEAISKQRFIDQPVVNPSMLVRRSVFETHGTYRSDLDWAEDYDFWLRLLQSGGKIAKVPEVLFTWTDHPARLTRSHDDYTQDAFTRCKAHFLSQLPLVRAHGIIIAGAGPNGKSMAKALRACGTRLHHFYDVHPRRIGQAIQGLQVQSLEDIHPSDAVLLGAVGQPGKRAEILNRALANGYTEGEDFFSIA